MEKRNHWFNDYQQIGDRRGLRKLADRMHVFRSSDFAGKSVLDIGCNIGQMSFFAAERGAVKVTGIEYDEAAFKLATELKRSRPEYRVCNFKLDDIENPTFWHHVERHDTVLFLSMIDTKELTNKYGDLAKCCMKTAGTLYYEGHQGQSHLTHWGNLLRYTDFPQIIYVGASETRPVFRCSRQVLNGQQAIERIRTAAMKFKRIAITGNQMAGKSTLLGQIGSLPGFEVIDDCDDMRRLLQPERLVFADHKAAMYLDDFEVVFNLLTPPDQWEMKRSCLPFTRSSEVRHRELREFYSVDVRQT